MIRLKSIPHDNDNRISLTHVETPWKWESRFLRKVVTQPFTYTASHPRGHDFNIYHYVQVKSRIIKVLVLIEKHFF